MVTAGWLSAAVEKTCFFCVGIVVLRSTKRSHHAAHCLDTKSQRSDIESRTSLTFRPRHRLELLRRQQRLRQG